MAGIVVCISDGPKKPGIRRSRTGRLALIYIFINGKPPAVRAKFQKAIVAGAQVFVSAIALFELWYGVAKSSRREINKKRVEVFLAGPSIRKG